jgi:hypothetical protein
MEGLSDSDKEKVLGGNAMRMFGLNGNGAPSTEAVVERVSRPS